LFLPRLFFDRQMIFTADAGRTSKAVAPRRRTHRRKIRAYVSSKGTRMEKLKKPRHLPWFLAVSAGTHMNAKIIF
jgi:hypothetical protein